MELTSLVAAGLFWLCKLDNRTQEAHLPYSDTKINQDKEKIARLEKALQMAKKENERLNDNLYQKSQEIANLLISVERKNRALEGIKKNVKDAIGKVRLMKDKSMLVPLLNMNMEINENLNGDSILERFEEEYNFFNNDFLHRLSARFPILNSNERKVCVYLRMNRTTKEIATLLNLSVRGVETIRYHLRQKLGLERSENLCTVLADF